MYHIILCLVFVPNLGFDYLIEEILLVDRKDCEELTFFDLVLIKCMHFEHV